MKVLSFSEKSPKNIVEQLSSCHFSCRACDNIQEKKDGFFFDSYRKTFTASSYSELLVNLIHTRYTYDDENNLINDFIDGGENSKYRAYRNYVSWAKKVAQQYFDKE